MFRKATSKPPYPDTQTCVLVAECLNGISSPVLTYGHFARSPQGIRLREAISTILNFVDDIGCLGAEFVPMCDKLRDLSHTYLERAKPKAPEWLIVALPIWSVAEGVLTEIGRRAGKTCGSVAIEFTALALQRIGFGTVSRRALANWIIELDGADEPLST